MFHHGLCTADQVFKVRSKEDGKLYAVKRSRQRFRGELDRCVCCVREVVVCTGGCGVYERLCCVREVVLCTGGCGVYERSWCVYNLMLVYVT